MTADYPRDRIESIEELEDLLSRPTKAVVETMAKLDGDLLILGAAGKMGPTLARMARRAWDARGIGHRVIAVSRFSEPTVEQKLRNWGIETISGDLLNSEFLNRLPNAPYLIHMAGMKFGATGQEALTWAMNSYLPGMVCQRFAKVCQRLIAFSTGNVYGLTPVAHGGSLETDSLDPKGEYAMSCLGRERIFEHFSRTQSTPAAILRLNYAVETRYGVLVDLALKVQKEQPISLSMGHLNAIWQGDANALALLSLSQTTSPPKIINIAGPELLSVRQIAQRLGQLLGKTPILQGAESPDALLNNAQQAQRIWGYPQVPIDQILIWIANWISRDLPLLGKPTKFESRDGKF